MKSPAPKTTGKINKKRARGRADKADPARILKVWLTAWDFMRVISKNKNPSQRLLRFFSIIDPKKATSEFRHSLLGAAKSAESDKGWCETNFNLQNSEVFELYARVSLSLDPNKVVDQPVLQAFQKAKMDPEDPLNWRMLMTLLCWSNFPPERPAGHPRLWTSERYCQLLQEIHKLKPRRQRDHWESEACDKLSKKMIFKDKHGPLSGEALRRALQQARDPEHNYTLSSLINEGLRVLEEDYKRRGHVWPPVHLEGVLARVHGIGRRVLASPPVDKGSWEEIQPRSLGSYSCRGFHVIGRHLPMFPACPSLVRNAPLPTDFWRCQAVAGRCRHHRSTVDVSGPHDRGGQALRSRCPLRRGSRSECQNDGVNPTGTDRQDAVR
jgi:hypothetical protein